LENFSINDLFWPVRQWDNPDAETKNAMSKTHQADPPKPKMDVPTRIVPATPDRLSDRRR
jgi:hypothetical protein